MAGQKSPRPERLSPLRSIALLMLMLAAAVPLQAASKEQSIEVVYKQTRTLRVFGEDERQPIHDTTQLPWSAIGRIESVWYRDGVTIMSTATGTLIGNRVVLTGGHCIYDQEDGWADQVAFIPGKNGDAEPFGRAYSVRNITQRAWVEEGDSRYDLGMIVLDEPLGERAGFMSVAVESVAFFNQRTLNSAGYPGEVMPGDRPFYVFGQTLDFTDGLIRHMLDSEPGQSGSPLWYLETESSDRRIVGVLTGTREVTVGGQLLESYNVAVRINEGFADWINETLSRYDTVVQDIAVGESSPTVQPACGAGLPGGAVMAILLLMMLSSLTVRYPRLQVRRRDAYNSTCPGG
ncbi:MAG TPA: trypsin-like serine protease [Phycisphaerae bacterium]|nr:trypsin-like serine protease [Phycisphaerae bacterium]